MLPLFGFCHPSARSVFRNRGVDALRPGQDSARKVVHFFESRLAQEIDGLSTPNSRTAVGHELAAGIELVHTVGKLA